MSTICAGNASATGLQEVRVSIQEENHPGQESLATSTTCENSLEMTNRLALLLVVVLWLAVGWAQSLPDGLVPVRPSQQSRFGLYPSWAGLQDMGAGEGVAGRRVSSWEQGQSLPVTSTGTEVERVAQLVATPNARTMLWEVDRSRPATLYLRPRIVAGGKASSLPKLGEAEPVVEPLPQYEASVLLLLLPDAPIIATDTREGHPESDRSGSRYITGVYLTFYTDRGTTKYGCAAGQGIAATDPDVIPPGRKIQIVGTDSRVGR